MEIRPTTDGDLEAAYGVFRAAIDELFDRHSFAPPNTPLEAFVAQQGHVLGHDGDRCFAAVERGRLVAFVSAFVRDGTWYLSSLFVRPEYQGRGLGRRLLERAWGNEHARRLTIADSIQPISNGLYAQMGLVPATPVLRIEGVPGGIDAPDLEPREPSGHELATIDAQGYGFSRAVDHDYWRRHARLTLWVRGGVAVAYSYAWSSGRIGPVGGLDGADAASALRAELARAPGPVIVLVPGSARELVMSAVEAGLRFAGPPGLLLVSEAAQPPTALAISGFTLF